MTTTPDSEPTLQDLANKLDKLTSDLNKSLADNDRFKTELDKFNDRFSNYQRATQWVMQLAFTLIASATLTVIITAVVRK
ncbi:hypothetical protein [Leptodesmis sichuanensis]|uniref:hypothetical protein n=1 Tax=Leptodesmis sichuanensis TaxID=2906798 RepID=UPI001F15B18E|nr:hypothetical protein [Leptodesmis sichuanensis]UIE36967.1 hypothetical protein KIK02_18485 [Leptodesmis sichuanensis A121]